MTNELTALLDTSQASVLRRALDEADERRRHAAAAAMRDEEETLEGLDEEELDAFILSEEEVRIKERVWVELNREYLEGIAGACCLGFGCTFERI